MSKHNIRNTVQINKYVVIPEDESGSSHSRAHEIVEAVPVNMEDLLSPALGRVSQEFHNVIPEAASLTWNDRFFDDEDDIIAVFDFDYDEMEKNCLTAAWAAYFSSLCVCPAFFWIGVLLQVPCYIGNNAAWHIRSQHLALTSVGVLFVHDGRKSLWGSPCSDFGRTHAIIPFNNIKTCKIEGAGCTEKNQVIVENANVCPRYLKLTLKDAVGFRNLVAAMMQKSNSIPNFERRRGTENSTVTTTVMHRAEIQDGNSSDQNVTVLLSDIRDELRRHNQRENGQATESVGNHII